MLPPITRIAPPNNPLCSPQSKIGKLAKVLNIQGSCESMLKGFSHGKERKALRLVPPTLRYGATRRERMKFYRLRVGDTGR